MDNGLDGVLVEIARLAECELPLDLKRRLRGIGQWPSAARPALQQLAANSALPPPRVATDVARDRNVRALIALHELGAACDVRARPGLDLVQVTIEEASRRYATLSAAAQGHLEFLVRYLHESESLAAMTKDEVARRLRDDGVLGPELERALVLIDALETVAGLRPTLTMLKKCWLPLLESLGELEVDAHKLGALLRTFTAPNGIEFRFGDVEADLSRLVPQSVLDYEAIDAIFPAWTEQIERMREHTPTYGPPLAGDAELRYWLMASAHVRAALVEHKQRLVSKTLVLDGAESTYQAVTANGVDFTPITPMNTESAQHTLELKPEFRAAPDVVWITLDGEPIALHLQLNGALSTESRMWTPKHERHVQIRVDISVDLPSGRRMVRLLWRRKRREKAGRVVYLFRYFKAEVPWPRS